MKRVFLTCAIPDWPGHRISLLAQGDEIDIALAEAGRQVKYGNLLFPGRSLPAELGTYLA